MISGDYCPLVVAAAAFGKEGIEFRTRTERIELNNHLEVVNEVLRLSDGRNPASLIGQKVASKQGCDGTLVLAVINGLDRHGIVIDSRTYASYAHLTGNNPMPYFHDLSDGQIESIYQSRPSYLVDHQSVLERPDNTHGSPLRELLSQRASCRSFGDEPVSYRDCMALCEMAYDNDLVPVPSGGALYPLSLFLLVRRGEGIAPGIYQYDPAQHQLNVVETPLYEPDTIYALGSDTLLHNASAIAVVAGDLARHPSKYANRGYRYTLIEAGHVAQCLNLTAIEMGYAVLEYGGFNDEPLRDLLRIKRPHVWPLVCVAIGKHDPSFQTRESGYEALQRSLTDALVGKGKPLNWVSTLYKEKGDNTPFYSVIAHYKPGPFYETKKTYNSRISAGTSASQDLALVKAMAEGYERYVMGQPYVDVVATAHQLDAPWVDPNVYTPFTEWQMREQGFEPFNPSREWQWVKGEDGKGSLVYVPTDLVFYPYGVEAFGRKLCYMAHSNGCAAHVTLEDAKLNAMHELLERDAIARNWMLRETPRRFPVDLLPLHWKKRVIFWQGQGWRVDVVDFSHSGVAIVCVFARKRNNQPYLTQGSSASCVDLPSAFDKAFQEMEIGIHALSGRRSKRIPLEKVDTPADHGQLYRFDDYASKLDYLFEGDFLEKVPVVGGEGALDAFDPVYVTVSPDGSPLKVVRALSAKLVPINFGYGRDHIAHHIVKERVDQSVSPFPHYLA